MSSSLSIRGGAPGVGDRVTFRKLSLPSVWRADSGPEKRVSFCRFNRSKEGRAEVGRPRKSTISLGTRDR